MGYGKLLCVLGLASALLAGYVHVAGVVGPWMAGARALSSRAGAEGRTAGELARDLGVEADSMAGPVLARGSGVFGAYALRVRRAGGF